MSSSTSSSSAAGALGTGPDAVGSGAAAPEAVRPRARFLKVWLTMIVGMTLALGLVRFVMVLNDASGESILDRETEAIAALPRIVAEPERLVIVYGSSMVEAGFSARLFDRDLAELGVDDVKSFNFGFGGLNPYFQDYLARRIRDAFLAGDRRLELAIIEFNPFQTTKARWAGAQPVVESFTPMLASPEELWQITLNDPERGLRMLVNRYLRDGISAEMTTWYFGEAFRPSAPRSDLPEDEEAMERLGEVGEALNEAFEREYPDYRNEAWNYGWQGAGTIPQERSAETLAIFEEYYQLVRTPRLLENDRLRRIFCCDIEGLDFEEELIAAFIRTVKVFQEFSDRVEILLLPRNTKWIEYSPEAEQRLAALLERIAAETAAPIRNWQEIEEITPEMYSDTTHLARYAGDVVFTRLLAEAYAPLLGGAETARGGGSEGLEEASDTGPD